MVPCSFRADLSRSEPSRCRARPYYYRNGNDKDRGHTMTQRQAGYGRSWKRWLAIYLAVAAVAYLVIYLVFFTHGGGGGGY